MVSNKARERETTAYIYYIYTQWDRSLVWGRERERIRRPCAQKRIDRWRQVLSRQLRICNVPPGTERFVVSHSLSLSWWISLSPLPCCLYTIYIHYSFEALRARRCVSLGVSFVVVVVLLFVRRKTDAPHTTSIPHINLLYYIEVRAPLNRSRARELYTTIGTGAWRIY